MSFNVSPFLNNASKTITDRAVITATTTADNILGGNGIADLGLSILSSGSSISALTSIASLKFDQVLDKAATDWFDKLKGDILGKGKGRTPSHYHDAQIPNEFRVGPNLKYPSDLDKYAFVLKFYKYRRPVPLTEGNSVFTVGIYLPLPKELTGGQDITYSTPQLGTVGNLANGILRAFRGGVNDSGLAVDALTPIVGALEAIGGSEITTAVEQGAGVISNPNISVAFNGPSLREFTFTWDFSPNNTDESAQIQEIIRELQRRALPSFTVQGTSSFMAYPEMVHPFIKPDGKGQIGDLMKFKYSMIKSIRLNYSTNGIPSFFKDGSPQFIQMSLSIVEMEYFLSQDYGGEALGTVSHDLQAIVDFINGEAIKNKNAPKEKPQNPNEET